MMRMSPQAAAARLAPAALVLLAAAAAAAGSWETGVDRHGGDYRGFDLLRPDPGLCEAACGREARCLAWTFVKPGVQGENARCWLKEEVPEAAANDCCVSGVKRPVGMEVDTDRPGGDYRGFDLLRSDPGLCEAACRNEAQCRAWTYVKPGVQGEDARCWLKEEVPQAVTDQCCVSGVKRARDEAAAPKLPDMEVDVNRPGGDYRDIDLSRPDPALCRAACTREARCLAWTFVKPGVQGENARCWLKNEVPEAEPNDCCVSGVK